jgi:methyltransferase (TIGR00027 family)
VDAGQPSRTALATAAARAAHRLVDRDPLIFDDALAGVLLGDLADALIAVHRHEESAEVLASMRVAMTARSRYTEDRLAEAIQRGVGQFVLLGAGLDSFAYRSPFGRRLLVFEVDHPATQAWKRARLAAVPVPVREQVSFVAVDFNVDPLSDRLLDAGFDRSRPAFVSWLGVTQYLTADAIGVTLEEIGGLCAGTELVMEYVVPAEMRDGPGRALADYFMPRAAASGEPWLTFLTPADVAGLLAARRMKVLEDVGRSDQIDQWLWKRSDRLRAHQLGRIARAVVAGPRRRGAPHAGRKAARDAAGLQGGCA